MVPQEVVPGGKLTLSADLPAKLLGFWIVGDATLQPLIGPPPLRVHVAPRGIVVLPTAARGAAQLPVAVPQNAALSGIVLAFQMAVVPEPGLAARPLSLPPGRFVRIQ